MVIVPNVSVGPIKAGMSEAEVVALLGQADTNHQRTLEYWNLGVWVNFQEGRVHIVMCVDPSAEQSSFKKAFVGHTQEGIAIGSSRAEILQAYGEPSKTETSEATPGVEILRYHKQGLFLSLRGGKLKAIGVIFHYPK
jgi:hypothetical protein